MEFAATRVTAILPETVDLGKGTLLSQLAIHFLGGKEWTVDWLEG
jgi:hypothetical protein